jgi:hypothetical protein
VVGRSFTGWLVLAAFVLDDVGLSFRHDILPNSQQRSVPEAGSGGTGAYRAASPDYSVSTITARAGASNPSRDQTCRGSNLPSAPEGGDRPVQSIAQNSGLIGTRGRDLAVNVPRIW